MTRRAALFSLFALLAAAGPAAAEEASQPAQGAPATGPDAKARRVRRKRPMPRRDAAAGPQPPQAAPEPDTGPRLEAAPVPNRDLEAPRAPATPDRARLSPSVIHKRLPNQGMASEGAQSIQEERLFFPAPGARLNVPFSY